ncbi:hypothetical protein D3248_04540 [Leucobacter zeae]|nr:hypothetical protein [Leucobacter zeae]
MYTQVCTRGSIDLNDTRGRFLPIVSSTRNSAIRQSRLIAFVAMLGTLCVRVLKPRISQVQFAVRSMVGMLLKNEVSALSLTLERFLHIHRRVHGTFVRR